MSIYRSDGSMKRGNFPDPVNILSENEFRERYEPLFAQLHETEQKGSCLSCGFELSFLLMSGDRIRVCHCK